MAKKTKYSLLIICEGKNTEPQFFATIRDRIKDGKYPVEEMEISIRPEPINDDAIEDKQESSLRPKRKTRVLLPAKEIIEEDIQGVPPLKWVLAGQKELIDGTFNEVWVVFDNDNHPAKTQAFTKADEAINGTKVNIAYSSIAFEYYLLLHFERIHRLFEKSECREGKKLLNCNSGNHRLDCHGTKCIGGYARNKKHWTESKSQTSTFPLIEDKLEIGFYNSAWLRKVSSNIDKQTVFYNRNPYVTTDLIVKRLTGFTDILYEIVFPDEEIILEGKISIHFTPQLNLYITNIGKNSIILPAHHLYKLSKDTGNMMNLGNKTILYPAQRIHTPLADTLEELMLYDFFFCYGKSRILLTHLINL